MAESKIEWTDATWNPTTGCDKVSSGCKNCYADRLSNRLKFMKKRKYENGFKFTMHESEIETPAKWKKPRMIFVNSMSDLFHEDMDEKFLFKCFRTMIVADHHIYQILTKRPERMQSFSMKFKELLNQPIPRNIWMGTSVENNDTLHRLDTLRNVHAEIRFVSFEPLLEELDEVDLTDIHWAIIGGESGKKHRPIEPDWVRSLIKKCRKQDVPVFFKQWGGLWSKQKGRTLNGKTYSEFPTYLTKMHPLESFN